MSEQTIRWYRRNQRKYTFKLFPDEQKGGSSGVIYSATIMRFMIIRRSRKYSYRSGPTIRNAEDTMFNTYKKHWRLAGY